MGMFHDEDYSGTAYCFGCGRLLEQKTFGTSNIVCLPCKTCCPEHKELEFKSGWGTAWWEKYHKIQEEWARQWNEKHSKVEK